MDSKKNTLTYADYIKGIEDLNPDEQLRLVEIISARLKGRIKNTAQEHRITELEGLGADLWKDMDVQEYIRGERASWD